MNNKTHIVWVTNMPAPYRMSIFDNLSEIYNLQVIFMLGENNWRGWRLYSERKWTGSFLNLRYRIFADFEFIPGLANPYKVVGKPDYLILGSWESPFYLLLLIYGKFRRIPVIGIYESHTFSQRFRKGFISCVRKSFFKSCFRIISFGGKSSEALRVMGIASSKIISLYNPIDTEFYKNFSEENWVKSLSGHRYLFVGQLIPRKNIHNLIKAFAKISNESDTLEIVGGGNQFDELSKLVRDLKCEKKVSFMGQLNSEEIVSYYAKSDTLVLPSTREVWGLVVNEALASGLHVVVSENCGVSELVGKMNGVYVCAGTIESIEDAMVRSRQEFTSRIVNPEISNFSTNHFARELSENLFQNVD